MGKATSKLTKTWKLSSDLYKHSKTQPSYIRKSYFPTPTTVTSNIHKQTKQRTQERHIKSCCVCVALVSVVWRVGGYWMSWRLAFDNPPINNKQPTTSQPKSGHRSDTSSHDVFVSLLCPLFGVLVDIGCHGDWPTTPTTHPKADTGATTKKIKSIYKNRSRI